MSLRRAAALLALAGLGLAGCEDVEGLDPSSQELSTSVPGDLLAKMAAADVDATYRGVRYHRSYFGDPLAPDVLAYREDVASDGQGQFALQVIDLLEPTLPQAEEDLELQLLALRQGFSFRYRGFGLRDLTQLSTYWVFSPTQQTVQVAGVDGDEILFELSANPTSRWTVVVEPGTGLVLSAIERDLSGNPLSETWFETLDFAPDFSGVVWHTPSNAEVAVPLGLAQGSFSFGLLTPALLPAGYRYIGLSQLTEPGSSRSWAKQVYTNGVDLIFFLYADASADPPPWAAEADRVRSMDLGPWRVLDGSVRDYYVILAGGVPEADLAQMLQSALPE